MLGRILGRRVVDRHSKITQLPFKNDGQPAAGSSLFGRRTVYYRWMFRRRSAAPSFASFLSPRYRPGATSACAWRSAAAMRALLKTAHWQRL